MSDAALLERSAYLAENPSEVVPWSYTDEELEHLAAGLAPHGAQSRYGDENVTHPRVHARAIAAGTPRLAGAGPTEGLLLASHTLSIINGRPYAADGGRFGTYPHGLPGEHFDCSGSQARGLNDLGHAGVPTVSATQARWCRDNGLDGLSIERAAMTPGACLFVGPNHGYDGFGPEGHVVGCLGNGWTYEARGRAYGCGSWPIIGRRWDNAGLWPGVNYMAIVTPPPEPVPAPPPLDLLEDTMMLAENNDDEGVFYLVTSGGVIDCPDAEAVKIRTQEQGQKLTDLGKVGGWVLQKWDDQLRGRERTHIATG